MASGIVYEWLQELTDELTCERRRSEQLQAQLLAEKQRNRKLVDTIEITLALIEESRHGR